MKILGPVVFDFAAVVMLCSAIWFSFGQVFDEGWDFIPYDDDENFEHHEKQLKTLSPMNLESWIWAFQKKLINVWEPLAWIAKFWVCQNFGFKASVFRTSALFCHTLSSLLMYKFCSIFLRFAQTRERFVRQSQEIEERFCALSGAFLFALHPVTVQVVGWASASPYALSLLFHIACIAVYALPRFDDRYSWREAKNLELTFSSFLYLCSTLTKSYSIFTPVLVGLIEIFWLNFPIRQMTWMDLLRYASWRTGFGFSLILQSIMALQTTAPCRDALFRFDFLQRISLIVLSFTNMLSVLLWPVNLLLNYGFTLRDLSPLNSIRAAWSFTIIISLILASLFSLTRKGSSYFGVCIAWCLIAFVPGSGIVIHNTARLGDDRYVYFALPALSLCFSLVQNRILVHSYEIACRKTFRVSAVVFMQLAIIVGLSHINIDQLKVWRTFDALSKHTLTFAPRDWTVKFDRLSVESNKLNSLHLGEEMVDLEELLEEELPVSPVTSTLKREIMVLRLYMSLNQSLACFRYQQLHDHQNELVVDFYDSWMIVFNNLAICHLVRKTAPISVVKDLLWKAQNLSRCDSQQSALQENLKNLDLYNRGIVKSFNFILLK